MIMGQLKTVSEKGGERRTCHFCKQEVRVGLDGDEARVQ